MHLSSCQLINGSPPPPLNTKINLLFEHDLNCILAILNTKNKADPILEMAELGLFFIIVSTIIFIKLDCNNVV